MKSFIKDLLANTEIQQAELRWKIAQTHLATGCSQREAMRRHRASQDLVRRVFKPLKSKKSGYRLAYDRLLKKQVGLHQVGESSPDYASSPTQVSEI